MGNKPFLIATEHFGVTYHGIRTPSGHYKSKKRVLNPTEKNCLIITNQSQKNLCILIDSIPEFICRYKLSLSIDYTADFKKSKTCLNLFTRYLSKKEFNNGEKPPLFFWKKKYEDKLQIFEILTNAQFSFSPAKISRVMQYLWFKYSQSYEAKIEKVNKADELSVISDFALNFKTDIPEELAKTGRWWGAINRKYYNVKPPVKKYYSLRELIEIESEAKQNIMSNLFIK
ncbi:MAG: hypothetical protein K5751_00130 [Treponemataceae bacterium]|nr:hypothetical protein [Treponemataceae bacterium]